MELGWGASSKLSTTTLSLKLSQTRLHSLLQNGRPSWWSMHDIFICKIVGLCMIFSIHEIVILHTIFHLKTCWWMNDFFNLLNCHTAHDFFICKILGHMHDFFITENCWWIHDFFFICKIFGQCMIFFLHCGIVVSHDPLTTKKDILMYLSKLSYIDYWIFGAHPNPPIVSLARMICVSLFSLSK